MLQSYEAIYDHGKMKWLGDQPSDIEAHVIVTILPDKTSASSPKVPHQVSPRIAGKGKILGDIMSPAAQEEDWNCLK
jgi:hypothetical protein